MKVYLLLLIAEKTFTGYKENIYVRKLGVTNIPFKFLDPIDEIILSHSYS